MASSGRRGRPAESNSPAPAGEPDAAAANSQENIRVSVRLRPFTERERQRQSRRIVDIEQNTVALYNPKNPDESAKKFTFDHSYWSHDGFKRDPEGVNVPDPEQPTSAKYVSQERVFADLGRFLLENALEGYNSALLAYGQTGSGKSYTVSGYGQNEGILPRFARELFAELDKRHRGSRPPAAGPDGRPAHQLAPPPSAGVQPESEQEAKSRYEVHFSMIEIYNEVVRDLLAKQTGHNHLAAGSSVVRRGLRVREHPKRGFFVESLSSYPCAGKDEIESLIEEGQTNKSIAATSMNETSSRGHTIYEFTIRQFKLKDRWAAAATPTPAAAPAPPAPPRSSPTPTRSPRATPTKERPTDDVEAVTSSVVQLVDLAGSERMTVHVSGEGPPTAASAPRSASPFVAPDGGGRAASKSVRSSTSVRRAGGPASSASSSSSTAAASQTSGQSTRRAGSQHAKSGSSASHLLNSNHQQRFKESVSINQSLSALGNCIQVLSQYSQQQQQQPAAAAAGDASKQPKIPYRDSVLTKLLNRCCLGGNSKVVLIATLSPADANYDDTLSTLRFADRAKQIRTHATINRTLGDPHVAGLQRENERLKQMLDGRVTRSDDSSQTSNFDDSENMMDNFNGPKSGAGSPSKQRQARPERAGTVTKTRATSKGPAGARAGAGARKPKSNLRLAQENLLSSKHGERAAARSVGVGAAKLHGSVSNPVLAASGQRLSSDQMEQLVSSAKKKMRQKHLRPNGLASDDEDDDDDADDDEHEHGEQRLMRKSRSLGQGLAGEGELEFRSDLLDEIDLNELAEIIDDENLLSPDSDDSFNNGNGGARAKFDENMTSEEKATILNRLLSNSSVANKIIRKQIESSIGARTGAKPDRPRKAGSKQRPAKRQEPASSSTARKSNPFLSNLNPDEQLSGMITHIVAPGDTVLGKDDSSDLLIYGPGVRGRHAKLTRSAAGECWVEPLLEPAAGQPDEANRKRTVAVLVNGEPALKRTRLSDGDRLVFGSTNYFVFVRNSAGKPSDQINYDTAHAEVMNKMIGETDSGAVIQEIKDYTHRPGTGKKRPRDADAAEAGSPDKPATPGDQNGAQWQQQQPAPAQLLANIKEEEGVEGADELYRGKLIADTYEFAMPIAEANAIAHEIGIRVSYGLKILTGEEQLLEPPADGQLEPGDGEEPRQDSAGRGYHGREPAEADRPDQPDQAQSDQSDQPRRHSPNVVVSRGEPIKPGTLDVPPELYVNVRLDELGLDFYWTKEKFQERRVKMLELYGAWDLGGKSGLVEYLIEQSKYQGYYMIDPFLDDAKAAWVLVGHAQVALQPVSHVAAMRESFDVLDVNDELVGSVRIEALPCHPEPTPADDPSWCEWPHWLMDEEELAGALLDEPRELLDKRLVFVLRIVSCSGVPSKFAQVFCQYSLNRELPAVRTRPLARAAGADPLVYDHKHFVVVDRVSADILDFLQNGFLTIQLVGQYDAAALEGPAAARRPTLASSGSGPGSAGQQSQGGASSSAGAASQPSLVSTIISSINKYRFRMEQQGAFYANMAALPYPGGGRSAYANSLSDSANSANYRMASSSVMNSNSGPSSVTSASATINLFDQQNDDDEGINSMNGTNQENIIDMILTKRKLDRAENQLHYIKRTINIAEHHNKKHIPVKTVKKLLNSYGQELEGGSLEEMAAEVTAETKGAENKHSNCAIQ